MIFRAQAALYSTQTKIENTEVLLQARPALASCYLVYNDFQDADAELNATGSYSD